MTDQNTEPSFSMSDLYKGGGGMRGEAAFVCVEYDAQGSPVAVTGLPDFAQKAHDRLVAKAAAAALEEAINRVNGCDRVSEVQPAIRALISDPSILAKRDARIWAEAYLSGWVNGSNGVEPPDFGNPVFDDEIEKGEG